MSHQVVLGDVLTYLRQQPTGSFDAMLTDPPYGIRLMDNRWDYELPSVEVWAEARRVLKPGAFALVACAPRTQHRMAVNVEDGGFELRDLLAWVHASGFGRNSDISEGLDRLAGANRNVTHTGSGRSGKASKGEGLYVRAGRGWPGKFQVTEPASPNALRWRDYGSRLKPAMVLWTLARVPLGARTIPENVLKHDVGGLNIGGARVPFPNEVEANAKARKYTPKGRWPANLLHDGSAEALALFPQTRHGDASRYFFSPKASAKERGPANNHPAVKPLALTEYLANLLLPPPRESGPRRILVPYAGSGSEMIGAVRAGWDDVVGVELDAHYVGIARSRLMSDMN